MRYYIDGVSIPHYIVLGYIKSSLFINVLTFYKDEPVDL